MAGTAKNYQVSMVEIGPGDIWLNVAVPGAGARITLATDGTPDATANPSCVHLGMTTEGAKLIYTPNITEYESDEQTSPIIVQNVKEVLGIQGNMIQTLDTSLLNYLIAGGTRSTGSGYEEVALGGKQTVATFTVAYIAPVYNDTTKFLVYNLYKSYNKSGFNMDVSRKKMSSIAFDFQGISISSRAAGDQTGKIWKSV
ncbi:MAG TPA: hypothetical protein VIX17_11380 [Pyrinomonadaceae bacterium]|jgi:hypothetical protein